MKKKIITQAQYPKAQQGSPTEDIRKEALGIDKQTEDLIKSSHEQGADTRKCAEGLKSAQQGRSQQQGNP
eukprot:427985-Prorocentrum_lima.AAC.1